MTCPIKPLTVFLGSLLGLLTLVPAVEAKPLGYIGQVVLEWIPNSSQEGQHTFYVRVDWTGLCNGSDATDSRQGEFTVEVVFDCDPVIEWIGSPYPNPFFRGNPQKGDFTLAIEDGSSEARGATVRVEVFNVKGQTVYTNDLGMLIASLNLSSPWEHRGKVLWEGRNDSGNLVAAGRYFVRLKATPDSQVPQ